MSEVLAGIIIIGIQHIVTILVGMGSIYLGYRLFLQMPKRREGETKLDLPGGISILLSRVGPGTFFALFGAAMIVYSITKPLEVKDIAENIVTADGGNSLRRDRSLTGLGAANTSDAAGEARRFTIPRNVVIGRLNAIRREAENSKTGSDLLDLQIAVREAKLSLLREDWQPEWGDYDRFHRWVTERFGQGVAPNGLELAVQAYRQGE